MKSRRLKSCRQGGWRALAICTALACAAGLAISPSTAGAARAKGKPVAFGALIPLSGFLASAGTQIEDALNAYAKFVDSHGGIAGHELKWDFADNAYPSATAASVGARKLVADHVLGILNFGTPGVGATYKYLDTKNVPDLILYAGVTRFLPLAKSAALVFSSYYQQGEALGQYVQKKFPGQSVAVLAQNDTFGSNYLNGFKKTDSHVSVVQTYTPTNTTFSSQINAMQASGAKLVSCFCLVNEMTQLLQVGSSTGWDPTVITESSNAGGFLISTVGASLAQNVIAMSFFPFGARGATLLVKRMKKENASVPANTYTELSAALNQFLVKALSGKKMKKGITRRDVVQALTYGHVKGGWYGKTGRSGRASPAVFSCWRFTVIESGKTVPQGSVACANKLPRAT